MGSLPHVKGHSGMDIIENVLSAVKITQARHLEELHALVIYLPCMHWVP